MTRGIIHSSDFSDNYISLSAEGISISSLDYSNNIGDLSDNYISPSTEGITISPLDYSSNILEDELATKANKIEVDNLLTMVYSLTKRVEELETTCSMLTNKITEIESTYKPKLQPKPGDKVNVNDFLL